MRGRGGMNRSFSREISEGFEEAVDEEAIDGKAYAESDETKQI